MRNLDLIRYLYDEQPPPELDERLASDDALRAELAALEDVKDRLDRRPPARPDPATLEAVLRAARAPAHPARAGRFADRPARPRRRLRLAALGAGSLALTACLLLLFGYWMQQPDGGPALAVQTETGVQPEAEDALVREQAGAYRAEADAPPIILKQEAPARQRADGPAAAPAPAEAETDLDEAAEAEPAGAGLADALAEPPASARPAGRSGADAAPAPVPAEERAAALGALALEASAREAEPLEGARRTNALFDDEADVAPGEPLPAWGTPDDLLLVRWRIESLEQHLRGLNWGPAVPTERGFEAASERNRRP